MRFKTFLAAGVGAIALSASFAGGAKAQAVTGLYIGGGAGYNFAKSPGVEGRQGNAYYFDSAGTNRDGTVRLGEGFAGLASIGYGLGNGLRFELEGNYRQNDISHIGGFSGPGVTGNGVPGAFHGNNGTFRQYGAMVNALYDIDLNPYGINMPVVPYVGLGVGWSINDYDSVSATRNGPGGNTVQIDGQSGRFAYQGIVGVAYPIDAVPGLSLTAEYRYMGSLKADVRGSVITPTGVKVGEGKYRFAEAQNHTALLGLRYAFNAAPPVVAAPVTPVAPQTDSRTYLVFFDWDRADLTERARQVIAQAAQATTRVQVTRIEVSGYTDTSGTARYNQGLSVRRANNVKAELVRLGVPAASISSQGFGESNPLVATGPGVREPQNRRVQIVLR